MYHFKQWILPAFCLILACISGCDNEPEENFDAPKGILHPDTMKQVLIDIHLAEAAIERKQIEGDSATILAQKYYNEIYAVHDITEEQFKKSFTYYRKKPKQFERMYKELIEDMSKSEAELSAED